MLYLTKVVLSLAAVATVHVCGRNEKDPDVGRDMIEIVENRGYPIEEHFVKTDDGYILGVFRIPFNRDEDDSALNIGKPIVLLQHGLLDSSYTFVNNFVDQSLAYLVSDAGYDVWLGNARGNTFSKKHATLKTNSDAFWNFSWDQMAQKDVPAMIDYILDYTKETQLAYAAHSQGTLEMFAAVSYDTSLNDKIGFFGGLAPIAYESHTKSPILIALADLHVDQIFEMLGKKQFLPGIYILDHVDPALCNALPHTCGFILEVICGPSNDINDSRVEVYVSETPADTSVKNMAHWAQSARHNVFEMFDYGTAKKNEAAYGQPTPPPYNLSEFAIPAALYHGTTDWLADPKDVAQLYAGLNPDTIVFNKTVDGFAHLDFTWGEHANTEIYNGLIDLIAQYWKPGKVLRP